MNEFWRRTVGGVANDDVIMLAGTGSTQVGGGEPAGRLPSRPNPTFVRSQVELGPHSVDLSLHHRWHGNLAYRNVRIL